MSLIKTTVRAGKGVVANGSVVAAMLLLTASAALNVVQARRISLLHSLVTQIKGEGLLAQGAVVPPLSVRTIDAKEQQVRFDDTNKPTVIYFFSPACGWCAKNLQNIKTLSTAAGTRFRFIGVSAVDQGLKEYLTRTDLGFPVYMTPSEASLKAFKFGGTPGTLVISPDGHVLKNWPGAYMGDDQKAIQAYFGVSLPGLIVPPGTKTHA